MESMDCENLCPYEKGTHKYKMEVSDQILNMKSDNVHVDMEPFSHLTTKELNFNSRFNLQRSLSRKGEEKKMSSPRADNEGDAISSPKVIVGINEPQVHHQISIITSGTATTTATGTPTKSRVVTKRSSSFKQTSVINPRRILFFFATLSSMGTILLIYFTLSMARHNGDDNLLHE